MVSSFCKLNNDIFECLVQSFLAGSADRLKSHGRQETHVSNTQSSHLVSGILFKGDHCINTKYEISSKKATCVSVTTIGLKRSNTLIKVFMKNKTLDERDIDVCMIVCISCVRVPSWSFVNHIVLNGN